MFMLVKFYPMLKEDVGFGGTFLMHTVMSALHVPLATFCLPETSGLSLEQIQKLFVKRGKDAEMPLNVVDESGGAGAEKPARDVAT